SGTLYAAQQSLKTQHKSVAVNINSAVSIKETKQISQDVISHLCMPLYLVFISMNCVTCNGESSWGGPRAFSELSRLVPKEGKKIQNQSRK
ncbi:hypothetical protein, partial [Plesiomonas sp.]|uniref:hypothetical protein n=1 Tax=Plesiomonas sp. TaxID=2486279 RepID=UPI003F314FD8